MALSLNNALLCLQGEGLLNMALLQSGFWNLTVLENIFCEQKFDT